MECNMKTIVIKLSESDIAVLDRIASKSGDDLTSFMLKILGESSKKESRSR